MTAGRDPASYFVRLGDGRYRATDHTGGAWTPTEQHFSPMGGLVTHAIDRFVEQRGADDRVTSRLTFDILGTMAIDELEISVDVIRPGRSIELLEALVVSGGRAAVRARAWRLQRLDTQGFAGGEPPPMPAPDTLAAWPFNSVWPGGYIESIEYRPVEPPVVGRGRAWVRSQLELVAGEPASELARFVMLLDTANGIAVREPPARMFYPNVDLSVHLYRQPRGEWVGLDARVVFGPDGQGLTTTSLHDVHGAVGVAAQQLTVRPRT